MAQNIAWLDNEYTDVGIVSLPKTGGGRAIFVDPSQTTATISDVTSGKIFLDANGDYQTGTGSGGGGGASNVVTGTFTSTTAGASLNVSLNYNGSGYPIAFVIYPDEGPYNSSGTYYNLISRYAIQVYAGIKNKPENVPDYNNAATDESGINTCTVQTSYKSSTSSATAYSRTGNNNARILMDTNASSQAVHTVKFRNATTLSIETHSSNAYGFAVNIPYRYWIVYSE